MIKKIFLILIIIISSSPTFCQDFGIKKIGEFYTYQNNWISSVYMEKNNIEELKEIELKTEHRYKRGAYYDINGTRHQGYIYIKPEIWFNTVQKVLQKNKSFLFRDEMENKSRKVKYENVTSFKIENDSLAYIKNRNANGYLVGGIFNFFNYLYENERYIVFSKINLEKIHQPTMGGGENIIQYSYTEKNYHILLFDKYKKKTVNIILSESGLQNVNWKKILQNKMFIDNKRIRNINNESFSFPTFIDLNNYSDNMYFDENWSLIQDSINFSFNASFYGENDKSFLVDVFDSDSLHYFSGEIDKEKGKPYWFDFKWYNNSTIVKSLDSLNGSFTIYNANDKKKLCYKIEDNKKVYTHYYDSDENKVPIIKNVFLKFKDPIIQNNLSLIIKNNMLNNVYYKDSIGNDIFLRTSTNTEFRHEESVILDLEEFLKISQLKTAYDNTLLYIKFKINKDGSIDSIELLNNSEDGLEERIKAFFLERRREFTKPRARIGNKTYKVGQIYLFPIIVDSSIPSGFETLYMYDILK